MLSCTSQANVSLDIETCALKLLIVTKPLYTAIVGNKYNTKEFYINISVKIKLILTI